MRDIKFRAWIPDTKQMREVISFDFHEPDDCFSGLPLVKVWNHPSVRAAKIKGHVATYYKKDIILMQYTGLLDKNGKDIYEGDIVQYKYYRKLVKGQVSYGSYGFWVIGDLWALARRNEMEVIGNICESPELLEK